MATSKFTSLPALRRQHLLVELQVNLCVERYTAYTGADQLHSAGLKQACPDGIFVSLTPGDPSLWSGVMFVRNGPYAQAVLRFQISFPDSYPRLPPLVTFSTDIFHPLITPLTTYTYTTDTRDGGTVSASDSERLPPGGFSLQHGFPDWFGRVRRAQGGAGPSGAPHLAQTPPQAPKPPLASSNDTPSSKGSSAATGDSPGFAETGRKDASTFEVLRYIRSTFDDEQVLDSIPLNAAGNPGAWHAWRTHRKNGGKVFSDTAGANSGSASPADATATKGIAGWNWDGVWEERVKKGIAASLSEPVLYGGVGGADDVIRFLNMEDDDVEAAKNNLLRTLDTT